MSYVGVRFSRDFEGMESELPKKKPKDDVLTVTEKAETCVFLVSGFC
jgi:hypothetical protein